MQKVSINLERTHTLMRHQFENEAVTCRVPYYESSFRKSDDV